MNQQLDQPVLVLVCGSRSWSDVERIARRIVLLPRNTIVIHGGARGADEIAGTAANIAGLVVRVYPADWKRYGRKAGMVRNSEMLDQNPDLVIAFWDGNSLGTRQCLEEARRRGIKCEVNLQ